MLDGGAEPNAGYLWEGLGPFTALTGAFAGGEGDPPPQPDGMALARLLLENLLMSAAMRGFEHRVRLLLERGVDCEGQGTHHPIHQGHTPSQEAAVWGHPEIVELLARTGASSAGTTTSPKRSGISRRSSDREARDLASTR